MPSNEKTDKIIWIGRAITLLAVFPFIPSLYFKLRPPPEFGQQMAHLGFQMNIVPTLAILEGLCILLYLIPQTAVLGAVLFTGYLGGAICTHLRIGEPVFLHLAIGGFLWLGIYLREPRLRKLLPVRCFKTEL